MTRPKQKTQEPLQEALVRLAPEDEVVDAETGEVRRAGDLPPLTSTGPTGKTPGRTSDPAPRQELPAMGLVVRGSVVRRRRRQVGENKIEVVTYSLGPRPVEFEVWRPTGY